MTTALFASSLAQWGPDAPSRPRPTLAEAQTYCRQLAKTHYENFTVVSWLLPKPLRQHFANIYAYCRWADDLADETNDSAQSLRLLEWWERQLCDCYATEPTTRLHHPVFVALEQTILEFEIPAEPFRQLISAFQQDQRVARYQTASEVLDYCRRSANPVGRLILALGRVQDAHSQQLSDQICTGLQLANFCQDVANDWDRGRVYLPQETLRRFGYTEEHFSRRKFNGAFRQAMEAEVNRAEAYLTAGEPLVDRMPRELRFDVALFVAGGRAVLEAIRRQDYNVWQSRPALGKLTKLRIAGRHWLRSRRPVATLTAACSGADLTTSYRLCRNLARRSASNFAWAFWLLPREKRMAMYALYAFLRHTDDLGDNPAPAAERLAIINRWRESFQRALAGQFDHPLLPAMADTVRRFAIPPKCLFDVIDGVAMDCVATNPDVPRFATIAELEHYCELVASAVGTACIHIWGFSSEQAFEPARQCGLALQLTNILRDLKQDAAEGRIYLPADELALVGYTAADLRRGVRDMRFAELMQRQVARAEGYYHRAAELEKYLDPAGQRLLGTMVTTYRGLLEKIKHLETDVLDQRVRLSRWRKLQIAGRCLVVRPRPSPDDPATRPASGTAS